MDTSERKLKRYPDEGMLGGVCLGLARYANIDVAIVRAAFIALTVFSGVGLAGYVALWFLAETAEPELPAPPTPAVGPENAIETSAEVLDEESEPQMLVDPVDGSIADEPTPSNH